MSANQGADLKEKVNILTNVNCKCISSFFLYLDYDINSNSSSRSKNSSRSRSFSSSKSSTPESDKRSGFIRQKHNNKYRFNANNPNYFSNINSKSHQLSKSVGNSYSYIPKYLNTPFKFNKLQKAKHFNKHNVQFEQFTKGYYQNRFQNYRQKNVVPNHDFATQATQNFNSQSLVLTNLNNDEQHLTNSQNFLPKKLPNYRLLGRNIFDANVKQQFLKSRKKTNTYYSRFIKQHPANTLPLAFQKSMSLAEDKALEEKERLLYKKDRKKKIKQKKSTSNSENETDSNNTDSDTAFSCEDENTEAPTKRAQKTHKFYSDISSGSELETAAIKKKSKKKKDKKKKKKKKQSKNKVST